MNLEKLYEFETGEKAMKGSSDYYTLMYVRWLESRYDDLSQLFKKAEPKWRIFNLFLHDED